MPKIRQDFKKVNPTTDEITKALDHTLKILLLFC